MPLQASASHSEVNAHPAGTQQVKAVIKIVKDDRFWDIIMWQPVDHARIEADIQMTVRRQLYPIRASPVVHEPANCLVDFPSCASRYSSEKAKPSRLFQYLFETNNHACTHSTSSPALARVKQADGY
jgi:hypothetical protein